MSSTIPRRGKQKILKTFDLPLSKLHVNCPENLYNNIFNNSLKLYPTSTRITMFNSQNHTFMWSTIETLHVMSRCK